MRYPFRARAFGADIRLAPRGKEARMMKIWRALSIPASRGPAFGLTFGA